MSAQSEAVSVKTYCVGDKNPGKIRCPLCGSLILLPNTAVWTEVKEGITLPSTGAKESKSEVCFAFWTVNDMFTFENVGFCNTVDNIKYLACADCEVGPIGAHFINDKKTFYVAPQRVSHEDNSSIAIK